jgi:hypothetical protein
MKTFIYYNKSDSTKEAIGTFNALDLEEAELMASLIKQMPIDSFLVVFGVEEI